MKMAWIELIHFQQRHVRIEVIETIVNLILNVFLQHWTTVRIVSDQIEQSRLKCRLEKKTSYRSMPFNCRAISSARVFVRGGATEGMVRKRNLK